MKRDSLRFSVFAWRRFQSLAIFTFALLVLASFAVAPFVEAQNPHPSAMPSDGASPSRLVYPETKTVEVVDDYFGTKVADPYRWLEDEKTPEVANWVKAQNVVTFNYLEKIPFRAKIKERLTKLYNYTKYTPPVRRGDYFFYTKNDGLQNQNVWYRQKGLDGTPEVLLDPNKLSADGTTKLGQVAFSADGRNLAYGVSQGGSDWNNVYVMDVASKQLSSDHLEWVKVSGIAWQGDGFYYSRYPAPEKGQEMTTKNENHQVFFHKIGTPQSQDVLVYEDKANPQRFHTLGTSDDEKFAFLTISDRGKGKKGNALFYRDLSKANSKFAPIVGEIGDSSFTVVDNVGDKFLISTDHHAPNTRVFLFDPRKPDEKDWKDILPEKPEPLDDVSSIGGKLFVTYLKDIAARTYVYSLDGKLENEIVMPGLGTVGGLNGRNDDKFAFYTFSSFNAPPTIYKYDIATRKSSRFPTAGNSWLQNE